MTRFLDLTAISAVEDEMKDWIEPFLESQKETQELVQSFLDSNQASIQAAASALSGVAEAVARINDVLPWQEITASYREMQKLTEIANFSFNLPHIVPFEPIRFGHLCVEVMEDEEEMIPTLIPDRPLTEEDKNDIAMRVVEVLKAEGLIVSAQKPAQPKLLGAPTIREILLVRLERQDKVRVVINGNYTSAFVRGLKKYWGHLVRIAEQERFSVDDIKGAVDYFNRNSSCPLYTRSGFGLTQILQIDSGYVVPAIPIEIISEKAFRTRLNKVT
jgi:hypothetical protein